MKLTNKNVQQLYDILEVCSIGDIDSIIIEDGKVRGVNESKTCVILSGNEIPNLGSFKMGLSRISALKTRINLFTDNVQELVINAKESDRGEISQLEISFGRNKVQFRCTATVLIKAPKAVNDIPAYLTTITKDEIQLVLNSLRAMNNKKASLVIQSGGETSIQISDATNDVCQIHLSKNTEYIEKDSSSSEVFHYSTEILSSILRKATEDVQLIVGESGTITTNVVNHDLIILPQIGD